MNARELQLAAIRHEISDRLSTDAICIENSESIADALGIAVHEVPDRLGIDGRIISARYIGEYPKGPDGGFVNEWSCFDAGDYGMSHRYPLSQASTIAAVEQFPWPDPALYDFGEADRTARYSSPWREIGELGLEKLPVFPTAVLF